MGASSLSLLSSSDLSDVPLLLDGTGLGTSSLMVFGMVHFTVKFSVGGALSIGTSSTGMELSHLYGRLQERKARKGSLKNS